MAYTPGADTARYLNRTCPCETCEGKGSYTATYGMTEVRTHRCQACDGTGKWFVRDINKAREGSDVWTRDTPHLD